MSGITYRDEPGGTRAVLVSCHKCAQKSDAMFQTRHPHDANHWMPDVARFLDVIGWRQINVELDAKIVTEGGESHWYCSRSCSDRAKYEAKSRAEQRTVKPVERLSDASFNKKFYPDVVKTPMAPDAVIPTRSKGSLIKQT